MRPGIVDPGAVRPVQMDPLPLRGGVASLVDRGRPRRPRRRCRSAPRPDALSAAVRVRRSAGSGRSRPTKWVFARSSGVAPHRPPATFWPGSDDRVGDVVRQPMRGVSTIARAEPSRRPGTPCRRASTTDLDGDVDHEAVRAGPVRSRPRQRPSGCRRPALSIRRVVQPPVRRGIRRAPRPGDPASSGSSIQSPTQSAGRRCVESPVIALGERLVDRNRPVQVAGSLMVDVVPDHRHTCRVCRVCRINRTPSSQQPIPIERRDSRPHLVRIPAAADQTIGAWLGRVESGTWTPKKQRSRERYMKAVTWQGKEKVSVERGAGSPDPSSRPTR